MDKFDLIASLLLESEQKTHMPEPEVVVPENVSAEVVAEVVKKVHEMNVRRYELLLQRARDINDGLEPTVDRNGRLHAPRDGYTDPNTDSIYRGGSYLPFPEEYYIDPQTGEMKFRGGSYTGRSGWRYQERVKMTEESANALKQVGDGIKFGDYFDISMGKVWEADGLRLCYAYIKASYKVILEAIVKFARGNEHKTPQVDRVDPATLPELAEGRGTFTGNVVSVKMQEGFYGYEHKMLIVLDDGNKIYGTVPASISDVEKGARVTFVANLKKKEAGFYFFSRPSKASIVAGQ